MWQKWCMAKNGVGLKWGRFKNIAWWNWGGTKLLCGVNSVLLKWCVAKIVLSKMPTVKFCCSMCIKGCLNYPTLSSIYYPIFCTVRLQHETMYEKNKYRTRDLSKGEKAFWDFRWESTTGFPIPLSVPAPSLTCLTHWKKWWVSRMFCLENQVFHTWCVSKGNFYNCVCLKLYEAKMGCSKYGMWRKRRGS